MNTRRNATRRVEQEITNVGVPPSGDQVPPLEEDVNDDQGQVNPPPLRDENIRVSILQMSQVITTSRNCHYSIPKLGGPSSSVVYTPNTPTSCYYRLSSKGFHLDESSYFLWIKG